MSAQFYSPPRSLTKSLSNIEINSSIVDFGTVIIDLAERAFKLGDVVYEHTTPCISFDSLEKGSTTTSFVQ
jgi:hypothetical protein